MANSPGSAERRAHLIREMAKTNERSHSRGSAASSMQSAHRDAHYDTDTQQLPAVKPESDFQINTSALRRAFPDFSQYGSSEEDSIELGRGGKRNARNTPRNIPLSTDASENLSLDLGSAGFYRITGTPPIKPRDTNTRSNPTIFNAAKTNGSTRRTISTKENEDPLVKTTDFVSGSSNKGSSKGSQNGHRSLAALHARVDSDDSGILSDGHLSVVTANTKNTRFGSTRAKQLSTLTNGDSGSIHGNENSNHGSGKTHGQQREQAMQNLTNTSNVSAGNGTHQSYVLPDIANITELVSGVRQDGTTLFPRSAKARSRFGTPSQVRRSSALKQAHIPIETVPIPSDQQALQLCLQLLQEKVVELEREKERSEKALDEYELEVLQLRSKLEEQEAGPTRSTSQGIIAEQSNARDWEDEKFALEISMKSLQERLDRANRKLIASEVTINNLTKDRHAAHQQLEVAHLNSEELRTESQAVRNEIESVKRQVARLTREHEDRIERLTHQETELRRKIERREKAINEMGSLASELWATRRLLTESKGSTAKVAQVELEHVEDPRQTPSERSFPKIQASIHSDKNAQMINSSQQELENNTTGQLSEIESTTDIREPTASQLVRNTSKDDTFLSFMNGDEIPKLRQLLEEDKAVLAKSSRRVPSSDAQETLQSASNRVESQNSTVPRKSSLKRTVKEQDATKMPTNGASVNQVQIIQDATPLPNSARPMVSFPREKEDTQRSIYSQRSERPRRSTSGVSAEMTSAFILPDITLTGDVLASGINETTNARTAKKSITIPRPVPVSERIPVPAPGEEDATIRPAQPPGLALATVLKGLEDELAQLRTQLAQQEALYNQHDPSLSKRKRKVVLARIQKLLAAIDMRADQIYALYDVLEGQKDKGQLMPEEEVEVTLQSVGIDLATARSISAGQSGNNRSVGAVGTVNGDEEDGSGCGSGSDDGGDGLDDLPWEGFEATQTQTLGSLRSLSRIR